MEGGRPAGDGSMVLFSKRSLIGYSSFCGSNGDPDGEKGSIP